MRTTHAKWTNSEKSYNEVVSQIIERWGEETLERYKPRLSCYTFPKWLKNGYTVRKGEKAIKTNSIMDIQDENEKVIATISIPVNLFHRKQIIRVPKAKTDTIDKK
ncbi:hypothetical protein ISS03_04240 [Patescibacteria group bacterium]|nr:hypothetical protein [Patescibacteria group bacterium]